MKHSITGLLCLLPVLFGWQAVHADDFNPSLPPEPLTKYAVTVSAEPAAGAASLSGAGKYTQGTAVTVNQTVATNYRFDYWTLNGVEYATTASVNYTVGDSAAHFVAHYTYLQPEVPEIKQVNISVCADPATGGTVSGAGLYTTGQYATLAATADANHGWSFDYWNKDGVFYSSQAVCTYLVGTEPAEFVAHFTYSEFDPATPSEPTAKYRVYTSSDPANTATLTGEGVYSRGEQITVKAVALSGWQFKRWKLNGHDFSDNASFSYTIGDSVAYFVAVMDKLWSVNVAANPSEAGTVTGNGSYMPGTTVTIKATAKAPYQFDYWTLNGVRNDAVETFVYTVGDSAALWVANFKDTTTFKPFDPTTPPEPLVYTRITATAPENYYFVSWNDGNTDNPRMVLASEAENYTPVFAPVDFDINTTATICSNEYYMLGDQRVTMDGVYKATLRSSLGSDSIVTLTLNVLPAYFFATTDTIYNDGSVQFIDTVLTTPGLYQRRYKTRLGCDSIWQRQLVLITDSVTVTALVNHDGWGTVSGGGKYLKGGTATLKAVPAWGYHFTHWNDGLTDPERQFVAMENIAFTANFAITTYEIKFVDWDGTELKKDSLPFGTAITAPVQPQRTGYTFTGWSKAFSTVDGDMIISAQYSINYYEIKFLDWDGTEIKKDSLSYGTVITAPADPTRKGYTFTGWDKTFSTATADLTITAQYSINSYKVQFVDWDGRELEIQTVTYGSAAIAPANPTRPGYRFTGWDKAFDFISADITVTAQYSITFYEIKFIDWDGTEIKKDSLSYGTVITAPADPTRKGYTFTGWDKTFSTATADLTITAQYSINSYKVQFVDWDGRELETQTVTYGSAATAPANPTRPGYRFTGWDKAFVYVTEDLVVTAVYQEKPSGNDTLCFYTLILTDRYNNGWDDNGQIRITDGTHEMYYRCERRQSPTRIEVPYYGNEEVTIHWVSGTATYENSITVLASNGVGIYYLPVGEYLTDGQLLFTMTEDHMLCRTDENPYCPQHIQGTVNSDKTMTLKWDAVTGASQYRIDIFEPDGTKWYSNYWSDATSVTTDVLSTSGEFKVIVVATDANGLQLGETQTTVDIELPVLTSVTVNVLVPTDCGMDISNGIWVCWWTEDYEGRHYTPATMQEGRRFTATFNPNAVAYNYFVINAEKSNTNGCHSTYSLYGLTTDTHCSEVIYSSGNMHDLLTDYTCSRTNHNYTPYNMVATPLGHDTVQFSWEVQTPATHYEIYGYDEDGKSYYIGYYSYNATQGTTVTLATTSAVPQQFAYWRLSVYDGKTTMWFNVNGNAFATEGNNFIPHNVTVTDNNDGTYTFNWEGDAAVHHYRISVYNQNTGQDVVYYQSLTTTSYTVALDDNCSYAFNVASYNAKNTMYGHQFLYFSTDKTEAHDWTVYVYIPVNADFTASDGYLLKWHYGGFSNMNYVPLISEGKNWYRADLQNITQDEIVISLLNGPSDQASTICLDYEPSLYRSEYLIVNRNIRGKRFISTTSAAYYPNDYLPYNLQAVPGAGNVSLLFETNESSRYYIEIYDENGNSVWTTWSSYYSDWNNRITANLSNETEQTYTWYIRTQDNKSSSYWDEAYVYGASFTVAPSPYIPQNLKAVYNGDGSCTVTWDAQTNEEISRYTIRIDGPTGTVGWAYPKKGESSSVVSFKDDCSGTYTVSLWPIDMNGSSLCRVETSFEIAPVAARDIAVRIIIQPGSGYDTSNPVRLVYRDLSWKTATMTEEGNGWYSYTIQQTSEPGIYVSLDEKDYWDNNCAVRSDTCLEYTGSMHLVDCDAHIMDYAPYSLQAVPGEGSVKLSWEVHDQVQRYYVSVYCNDQRVWYSSYSGDTREVQIALSNAEKMTCTWSVRPYNNGWAGNEVSGEEFTVQPSPYVPRNLQATANGDGTYTISWSPIEGEDYSYFGRSLYGGECSISLTNTSDTSVVSEIVPWSGNYTFALFIYNENGNQLAYAYLPLTVEPVAEHDIAVRVLVQPGSNYDTSDGVTLYRYMRDGSTSSAKATEEGNGWYSCTWTTTDPAIRIGMSSSYYSGINVSRDTCLEYTGYMYLVDCDARIMDYAPYNLQAVPGEGSVKLSWEVHDQAEEYYVVVYFNGEEWSSNWYYGTTRETTFTMSNNTEQTFTWSVRPYQNGWAGSAVYGEEFTLQPSPYAPKNLNATDNGDGTFTISWDPIDREEVDHYEVYTYDPQGNSFGDAVYNGTSYRTPALPLSGTYYYYVSSYNANWEWLGYAEATFEVAPVAEHDITVRMLIHPDSGYDTGEGISFGIYNYSYGAWETFDAKSEGGCWYSYTATTTERAIRVRFPFSSYYTYYTIARDTCLQYSYNRGIEGVACDAVAHDYRVITESMKAVSQPGRVLFTWSAVDKSKEYRACLVDAQTGNTFYSIYPTDTCFTYLVPDNYDSLRIVWAVGTNYPSYLDYVQASDTVMLLKSNLVLDNLTTTTTDTVTFDLGWRCNVDTVLYEIELYCQSVLVKHDILNKNNYRYTVPCNGQFYWQVRLIDRNDHSPLSVWKYGNVYYPTSAPALITNMTGSADGHILSFTWETAVPQVMAEIFRQEESGQYAWVSDSIMQATSWNYEVEEDGLYILQLRPYIEYEPGQYTLLSLYVHTTAHAFQNAAFTLQVDATEGGYVWPEGMSGSYPAGFSIEVYANPYTHYRFVQWSDGVTTATRTITLNSNLILTAQFERIPQYLLSVTAGEGGSIYVSGMQDYAASFEEYMDEQNSLYITAYASDGYSFYQWSDGVTQNYRYLNLTSDTTITAYFRPLCHLTIGTTEGGTVNCSGDYWNYDSQTNTYTARYGTQISLRANPDEGYRFAGWSDGEEALLRTFTITDDMTVTALFESTTVTAKYYVYVNSESGGNTSYIDGYYYEGDQLTLTATPGYGYRFTQWSDGVTDNPRTLVVSQDTSITAQFERIMVQVTLLAGENGKIVVSANEPTNYFQQSYGYGGGVTIQAVPDEHYHLVSWSDGSTSTNRTIYPTTDTTITVVFALDMYAVTFIHDDGSFIETQQWAYGTTPSCSITPEKQNAEFTGWTPEIVPVTGDAVYMATFSSGQFVCDITFAVKDDPSKSYTVNDVPYGTPVSTLVEQVLALLGGDRFEDETYIYTYIGLENTTATDVVTESKTYYVLYSKVEKTPTALENAKEETHVTKFLHDGQIFILRGEKIYTVTGQEVK